jgi:hypothetical protein
MDGGAPGQRLTGCLSRHDLCGAVLELVPPAAQVLHDAHQHAAGSDCRRRTHVAEHDGDLPGVSLDRP